MMSTLKWFPKLVVVVGVSLALGFGAKEAAACTGCTQPPPTTCQQYADPDLFCKNLCVNSYGCVDGRCSQKDECVCPL